MVYMFKMVLVIFLYVIFGFEVLVLMRLEQGWYLGLDLDFDVVYLGLYNFLSELNIEMNDCDCLNFGFLIVIYFMYFDMGIWLLISIQLRQEFLYDKLFDFR